MTRLTEKREMPDFSCANLKYADLYGQAVFYKEGAPVG